MQTIFSLGVIFGKGELLREGKKKSTPPSREATAAGGRAAGVGHECSSAGWVQTHLKMFGFIPVPVQQQHII